MTINFDAANHPTQNLEPVETADRSGYVEPTDVVHVNPFDTTMAKGKFSNFESQINGMLKKANKHEIVDDSTNIAAVEMATQSKKLYNEIEKLRKSITDEPRQFISAINNFAKVYSSRLKEIENALKAQISSYSYKLEIARRKAEQKAQKEAKKLQAKIDKEAKAKNIEPINVPAPVLPTKAEPTRTISGSASTRKVTKWEVTEAAKIPREYLIIDKVKINKAVKAGMKNIPGLRIYEDTVVALRA